MASQQEPLTSTGMSAEQFIKRLEALGSPEKLERISATSRPARASTARAISLSACAWGRSSRSPKSLSTCRPREIEKLLESPIHEVRAGAAEHHGQAGPPQENARRRAEKSCSTCTCGATIESTTGIWSISARRTWSAATCSTSRATSCTHWRAPKIMWERRTAIVSTGYFIRQGDLDDTFKIAEMLLDDDQDLIHKATGWMLRAAGDVGSPAAAWLFWTDTPPRCRARAALRDRTPRQGTAKTLHEPEN